MISINYRDPRPIYEQVRDGFRNLIIEGILSPNDKMPSVRELASGLAINPNTIQRAYRELEYEGYIITVAGKGSFVNRTEDALESRRKELLQSFDVLTEELYALGVDKNMLIHRLEGEQING